jgi:hypothetical protein
LHATPVNFGGMVMPVMVIGIAPASTGGGTAEIAASEVSTPIPYESLGAAAPCAHPSPKTTTTEHHTTLTRGREAPAQCQRKH